MNHEFSVFTGSYTQGANARGEGIYHFSINAEGRPSKASLVARADNPSYLLIKGDYLFAVNEIDNYLKPGSGSVSSYKIESDNSLTTLDRKNSGGANPVHLSFPEGTDCIILANYGNKTANSSGIAVIPVCMNGRLKELFHIIPYSGSSINPSRQSEPHAHSVNAVSLANGKILVLSSDLGTDRIDAYFLDTEKHALEKASSLYVNPGYGPRHLTFGPSCRYVYQLNELVSAINVCEVNPDIGKLTIVQTIRSHNNAAGGTVNYPAEILVHPSGRFLYASNRGIDSIALFSIDSVNGTLKQTGEFPTCGRFPRDFEIDACGRFLIAANQLSDNVAVFSIDTASGRLSAPEFVEIPSPVCVKAR